MNAVASGAYSISGDMRQTRNTPAVTMVAAWISADTGVGPLTAPQRRFFLALLESRNTAPLGLPGSAFLHLLGSAGQRERTFSAAGRKSKRPTPSCVTYFFGC